MKPRALVVDDEPLARQRLRDLVQEVPLVDIVGEAADGPTALAAIESLRPDVVFLDVEMPGFSGVAVLEQLEHPPAVVFTTAYDRYALAAFELAAVDYLVKPFGSERFRTAVQRALRQLPAGDDAPASRVREALAPRAPLKRVFVRSGDSVVPIALAEIERFEATDDYVTAFRRGRRYLLSVTLQALHRRLDPEQFARIHRSHVVNLDYLKALHAHTGARMIVEMQDGARLVASRAGTRVLRELTGIQ